MQLDGNPIIYYVELSPLRREENECSGEPPTAIINGKVSHPQ